VRDDRQRNSTIEKCTFCGQPISLDEPDAVQLHGENALVHESCLKEYGDEGADHAKTGT
jgi:hypothetical protein